MSGLFTTIHGTWEMFSQVALIYLIHIPEQTFSCTHSHDSTPLINTLSSGPELNKGEQ